MEDQVQGVGVVVSNAELEGAPVMVGNNPAKWSICNWAQIHFYATAAFGVALVDDVTQDAVEVFDVFNGGLSENELTIQGNGGDLRERHSARSTTDALFDVSMTVLKYSFRC